MDKVTVWNARLGINHCSRWTEFRRKVIRNIRRTFSLLFFGFFLSTRYFFTHWFLLLLDDLSKTLPFYHS